MHSAEAGAMAHGMLPPILGFPNYRPPHGDEGGKEVLDPRPSPPPPPAFPTQVTFWTVYYLPILEGCRFGTNRRTLVFSRKFRIVLIIAKKLLLVVPISRK